MFLHIDSIIKTILPDMPVWQLNLDSSLLRVPSRLIIDCIVNSNYYKCLTKIQKGWNQIFCSSIIVCVCGIYDVM